HRYGSDRSFNNVLRFDGETGEFIDEFVTSGSGGLNQPSNIVFGPDGHLYVISGSILRYDGVSGEFIDVFAVRRSQDALIDLAFGPDGNLYVSSLTADAVIRYDGTTGELIDVFASGGGLDAPAGLAFGPDEYLYVASGRSDQVLRYDAASGQFDRVVVERNAGELDNPQICCSDPTVIST
ncbi:MAG: hypothetical protein IID44_03035, partial [Planctomycetes bacterium]|nr:hypothetical protein [Planctomycetota bacterium]